MQTTIDDDTLGRIADAIRLEASTEADFAAKQVVAQRESRPIYIDRQIYTEAGGVLLPGVSLISNHAGGFMGPGIWEPSDGNTVHGLVHLKRRAGWRWGTKAPTSNFRSISEKFIECDQFTMDSGTVGNAWHTNIQIRDAYAQDCAYAQTWRRARGVHVEGLRIAYSRRNNTSRGVEINGGQEITYRRTRGRGGRTGIVCSVQGYLEAPRNVTIDGLEWADASEETIGVVDTRANEAGDLARGDLGNTSLLDHFRVTGRDTGGVCATTTHLCIDWTADTIADPRKNPAGSYAGRDITVVQGKNRETVFRISNAPGWIPTGVGKTSYKLAFAAPITAEQAAAFSEGDLVAIVAAPQFVRVHDVRIWLGEPLGGLGWQTGVSFWGGGYGCELVGAEIWGGTNRNAVRAHHVAGIVPRVSAFARRDLRSQLPVIGARIVDLTLHDCDLTLGATSYGKVVAETYRIACSGIRPLGNSMIVRQAWDGSSDSEPAFDDAATFEVM